MTVRVNEFVSIAAAVNTNCGRISVITARDAKCVPKVQALARHVSVRNLLSPASNPGSILQHRTATICYFSDMIASHEPGNRSFGPVKDPPFMILGCSIAWLNL